MNFSMKRATSILLFSVVACNSCALAATLFSSNFEDDKEGFTYADNTFRQTTQGFYASGRHDDADDDDHGYLEVKLGAIDNKAINGISGGWVREFTLPKAADVVIKLRYELYMTHFYESDEFAQALCSVDGVLVGSSSNKDFIGQIYGARNGIINYNWVTIRPGVLKAGSHRLTLGVYNNIKTTINEDSRVRFSNVILDYTPTTIATRPPTKSPIKPLTKAPVKPLTKVPVKPPTKVPLKPPTKAPVKPPTKAPTKAPVKPPTNAPTKAPVKPPTKAPTNAPVKPPSNAPIKEPTKAPVTASMPTTVAPVKILTKNPTGSPTAFPTNEPTRVPVKNATRIPTGAPTMLTTKAPTRTLTGAPVLLTTAAPTKAPVKSPTLAPLVPTSTGLFESRINAGSANNYVDPNGVTWEADKYFDGKGEMYSQCPMAIAGTDSDDLYCKERYYNIWAQPQPYRYVIPVPRQGAYAVKLHFAEILYTTAGQRVFNVEVNGKLAAKNLDIVAKAGPNAALVIQVTTQITGSSVVIEFLPLKENPKISAIEVLEVTDYVEPPTSAPVAQPYSMLINCGGSAFVEEIGGRTWNSDQYFIGGNQYIDGRNPVVNSPDANLYQTERYGAFRYEIPVPSNGSYDVILHFAELYWEEIGQRLFNIDIEDIPSFGNVDIVALGNGVRLQAIKLESIVSVTDGFVSIQLSPSAPQVDNPKLSGIEILARG